MYTRQQASQLKQAFWTAFGKYISPIPSAEGEKINWVNYKTGIKEMQFKMQADNKSAFISIEIISQNAEIRSYYYSQLQDLKALFNDSINEEWEWEQEVTDENGKTISRISKSIEGVNIFNQADWPELISFFKPRIIALDQFWHIAKLVVNNYQY